MDRSRYAAYDRWRNLKPNTILKRKAFKSVCYAPWVAMLLDPRGYVRACCQSINHSLGNVSNQRLGEIWNGKVNREFREKLKAYQLPNGCASCRWEIDQGNHDLAFSRNYDGYSVKSEQPEYPQRIDFSLSNNCNLECVQCYGEFSSSIRKNRDGLAPLNPAYKDQFFTDLRPFLHHLKAAAFLGGEPFLAGENYKVWDMMIEDGLQTSCVIITNGTVYAKRVERVLDHLPCSISISLDGATKETIEAIRQNAKYTVIMENLKKFKDYTQAKGTNLELSFCLMPQNQHEFADFLMFAEEMDAAVAVNTVYHPPQYSFGSLSTSRLSTILEQWEQRDADVQKRLRRHRKVWKSELEKLRNRLTHSTVYPDSFFLTPVSSRLQIRVDDDQTTVRRKSEFADFQAWSGDNAVDEVRLDENDTVVSCKGGFAGLPGDTLLGRSISQVLMMLRERYGADADVVREDAGSSHLDRTIIFKDIQGKVTQLRLHAVTGGDGINETAGGAVIMAAMRRES